MGRQRRNNFGRKPVDSCVVVLLIGASLVAGLSWLVGEAVRWIA